MHITIESRGYREVFGIAWLGCGLFTLLCLISFSRDDLSLYTTHPTATNFFGPVGAHWAALLVFSLGIGAYAFPALAFYLGVCLIFRELPVWRWKLLSGFVLLVSVAGILHLQPYLGQEWAAEVNTLGPGGFLGDTVNSYVLTLLFGKLGAGFALSLCYAASFSLFFDLQPGRVLRELNLAVTGYYRRREEDRIRKATPKDLLEMKQKEIVAQMRKLQQQLGDGPATGDEGGAIARRKLAAAAAGDGPMSDSIEAGIATHRRYKAGQPPSHRGARA